MNYSTIYRKLRAAIISAGVVVLGVASTGCEDFLIRDNPKGTTDEKWWVNKAQLEKVLSQLYTALPSGAITYDKPTAMGLSGDNFSWARLGFAGLSDEALWRANYIDWQLFTLGGATSSTRCVQEYYYKYTLIRRACRLLENYHRASIPNSSNAHEGIQDKDKIAAEARAIRAYLHLELFMAFGPIPIVEQSLTPENQYAERATQEQIVKFITEEFELAAEHLYREQPNDAEMHRFTKGAAYACQSTLYLFVGDYANAATAAKKVIDLNYYELYDNGTPNSYADLFTYVGQRNRERILYTVRGNRQTQRRLAPGCLNTNTGQANISPTAAMVNAYELKDGRTLSELGETDSIALTLNPLKEERDPRMRMTIWFPGELFLDNTPDPWKSGGLSTLHHTYTGYYLKKWLNPVDAKNTSTDGGNLDYYVIRYAEVLLNYVEGLVASGDWRNADVIEYLNQIRNRAGMPDVDESKYDSQEKLLELIRRERRVELAFEGQRLFDIRRLRIGREALNCDVFGAPQGYLVNDPTTHYAGQLFRVEKRSFADKDYLWPIPLSEINSNTNMTQNPGW